MPVKLTPILYEQLRSKHPELRLPMWSMLWPEDKKRAKRLTVDKLIVFRHMKLLARDPEITDRVLPITRAQMLRWTKHSEDGYGAIF